jgi:predicted  nucleic acid-binding Zn-ribbon protein
VSAAELKALNQRIADEQHKIEQYNRETNELQEKLNGLKTKRGASSNLIHQLKQQVEALAKKDIVVSEHAMLRYLERAHGIDPDELKQHILTSQVRTMINGMASGKFPLGNGMRAVVKDRVIITIEQV